MDRVGNLRPHRNPVFNSISLDLRFAVAGIVTAQHLGKATALFGGIGALGDDETERWVIFPADAL